MAQIAHSFSQIEANDRINNNNNNIIKCRKIEQYSYTPQFNDIMRRSNWQ